MIPHLIRHTKTPRKEPERPIQVPNQGSHSPGYDENDPIKRTPSQEDPVAK